jgi:diadenosine tetraphosphatase ApaH/serine/threonine PP2A family protein phosphatase
VRYGILGDIHANLAALRAVVDALAAEGVDAYLCLGDLVGYGADPGPCVEIVRGLEPEIVGGNHDWAAAGRLSLDYFNVPAREAIRWTQQVLPRETLAWLGDLELTRVINGITLSHSTLHHPEAFDYLFSPYDAFLSFRHLRTPLALVGHSHVPITFFEGNPVCYTTEDEIHLDSRRAISNIGSVGQPRDEDARAAYGIYDAEARCLTIQRVPYDVEETVTRIREVGLPPILGDRLLVGR